MKEKLTLFLGRKRAKGQKSKAPAPLFSPARPSKAAKREWVKWENIENYGTLKAQKEVL